MSSLTWELCASFSCPWLLRRGTLDLLLKEVLGAASLPEGRLASTGWSRELRMPEGVPGAVPEPDVRLEFDL